MMKQVIDNLREQEYVTPGNVEALRKYIRVKNPNSSGDELSFIFADALHKIIDTRIYQFEEKHRKRIKDDVIRKAVKKKEFSINAAEVFSSCLSLKLNDDNYIENFTDWINQNQSVPVSSDKVDKLVSSVEKLEEEYIESNLDVIIDEFETSWAEDTTLAELDIFKDIAASGDEQNSVLEDTAETEWLQEVRKFVDLSAERIEITAIDTPPEPETANEAKVENNVIEVEEGMPENKGILLPMIRNLAASVSDGLKYVRPSIRLSLPAAIPLVIIAAFVFTDLFSDNKIHPLQHQNNGSYVNIAEEQVQRYMSLESRVYKKLSGLKSEKDLILLDGLREEFKYQEIDKNQLIKWLDKKNSMLSEEPYFSAIMNTSKKYDIHPLLMFAIVGQEQAFVPRNGTAARKIANNPFNVYGSWEDYNTDIYDSSSLAADAIVKSSRNRPVYISTIRWINRRYAEDPNWWNGVSLIFAQMEKDINSKK